VPELRVRLDDIAVCELAESESPDSELREGEAQLQVERFALSTNNVSYAELGDELGYWRLFPAPEGWGRIPAWGYARVARSRADAVPEGRLLFGMVPMGSYLTVRPEARPFGLVDSASHRSELSPVYNRYLHAGDGGDDAELVMRPLFGTSVVLDLVLGDRASPSAAILTSASSKTAYGLAHLLSRRSVPTLGLTSKRHRDWVTGLELYDRVITYEQADEVEAGPGAVLVDFAGDRALMRTLHTRIGDSLARSIRVGFTHRGSLDDAPALPGPAPEFFFAPDEMVRRGRELAQRYVEAWADFAPVVERAMRIERIADGDRLVAVYRQLVAGEADPAVGYVATP
jgi:hypothetical protein